MTRQKSKDFGFWLNAWNEWLGPAGTGFPGWRVHPGGAEAGGLGDLAGGYSAFADAMKHFAQGTETGALGPRLADALDPIKAAAALGDGDRLLRAFLTAAPMSPFASLTKNWQNVTPSRQQKAPRLLPLPDFRAHGNSRAPNLGCRVADRRALQ
ncbi:MAG: hypothetical protein VX929_10380 [Pseudomonadota bacterium]|nr:hypothetical protein [Pseudomonadota bacterium]